MCFALLFSWPSWQYYRSSRHLSTHKGTDTNLWVFSHEHDEKEAQHTHLQRSEDGSWNPSGSGFADAAELLPHWILIYIWFLCHSWHQRVSALEMNKLLRGGCCSQTDRELESLYCVKLNFEACLEIEDRREEEDLVRGFDPAYRSTSCHSWRKRSR